jgi:hypothetical protein
VAAAAILLFALASAEVFARSSLPTPAVGVETRPFFWPLGPKSAAVEKRASRTIRDALDGLIAPASRLEESPVRRYRDDVERAASEVRQAIQAFAIDGRATHTLAILRCESELVTGGVGTETCRSLLAIASSRQPRDGDFQLQIADTYLRTGFRTDALQLASRIVAARPMMAPQAVRLLDGYGVSPDELLRTLGSSVDVLVALKDPFLTTGNPADYMSAIERALPRANTNLLAVYEEVSARQDAWDRLRSALTDVGAFGEPRTEAARLRLLGTSRYVANDFEGALDLARHAIELQPVDAKLREFLGDCLAATGRRTDAVEAYHRALALAVAGETSNGQRGRLYRKMGEMYFATGAGDRAFDAYRRALELVPEDEVAATRMRAITNGASRPQSGGS